MNNSKNMRYFNADFETMGKAESKSRKSGLKVFTSAKQVGRRKKTGNTELNEEERKKIRQEKKEHNMKRKAKKNRLIIRNLSFKVDENDLKKIFSQYGNVVEISLPKKKDGRKMGFAFVQFEDFKSSVLAIQNLNYKEILGRPVAVDYALAKSKFEHVTASRKISEPKDEDVSESSQSDNEDEEMLNNKSEEDDNSPTEDRLKPPHKEDKVSKFMKELQFDADSDSENDVKTAHGGDEESSSSESDEEEKEDDDNKSSIPQHSKALINHDQKKKSSKTAEREEPAKNPRRNSSNDIQEGKTVFVRNLSFETLQENFKEAMEEFGPVKYCLLCINKLTDHPKGTAFVKFEKKEDADKLIEKSDSGEGLFLDGRRLNCVLALSREEIQERLKDDSKEKKDRRNLLLLREGAIMANSEEAEGVSPADLDKRLKLERMKKEKLKNLNFFVSDKRLAVHNLPGNYSDHSLRQLFATAAGKGGVITEARVMKDFHKFDAKGQSKTKGFGFVSFSEHQHALNALHSINNNPDVFSQQKRPIVGFSVESHLALQKQERQREKSMQWSKVKKEAPVERNRRWKEKKKSETSSSFQKEKTTKRKKKVQKGSNKKKKASMDDKTFNGLVDKYKSNLLNK